MASQFNDSALQAGEDQTEDAEGVSEPPSDMAAGVEDAVDSELERVTRVGGLDAFEGALGCADHGAGQVAAAGVVLEVLAPGSAGLRRLLDEEVLVGGGEIVEISNWDLEILVGIVKPRALLVVVGFVRIRHGSSQHEV